MAQIDGWASERHGINAMLLVDAASQVIGAALFLLLALVFLGRVRGRTNVAVATGAHDPTQSVP